MTDPSVGSPDGSPQPTAAGIPFVCLILAAGRSRRFGAATKQLAELDGRPLIEHAVQVAVDAGASRVMVVVGHDGERVGAAARVAGAAAGTPVEIVVNADHAAGQSTSLVAGLRALATRASADPASDEPDDARADDPPGGRSDPIAVLLADQPHIDPVTVTAVVAAVAAGAEAARVRYLDAVAHPVAFAWSLVPRLRTVEGDVGARELLRRVDTVEVVHDTPVPLDVDTPADLRRLAREI